MDKQYTVECEFNCFIIGKRFIVILIIVLISNLQLAGRGTVIKKAVMRTTN
jgi:hypothetical protein